MITKGEFLTILAQMISDGIDITVVPHQLCADICLKYDDKVMVKKCLIRAVEYINIIKNLELNRGR